MTARQSLDQIERGLDGVTAGSSREERAIRLLMAKLANLLDEDHFAECEEIVRKAGLRPPEAVVEAEHAKTPCLQAEELSDEPPLTMSKDTGVSLASTTATAYGWFVKDFADGWIFFDNEADANMQVDATGAMMLVGFHPEYVRDLESPATAAEATVTALREALEKAEAQRDTYEEILRCVCHHLELPQSESGPADDLRLYDRALEAADLYTREADKELAENKRLRFAAEADAFRLREALKLFTAHYEPWMDRWADDAESSTFSRHTFGDLRRARKALSTIQEKKQDA